MIDVTLTPYGRSLMTMGLGVLKYQQVTLQKQAAAFKNEMNKIEGLRQDNALNQEISLEITSNMIDKRFTQSKEFIKSGGTTGSFQFKKSLSKNDKHLQYITQKQALKAQTRLTSAVSGYNKRLADKQVKTSFRLINLKGVL